MPEKEPRTTLSAFSDDEAQPSGWTEGRERLCDAEVFWLSTVRPDGRPHVTPLIAVWNDGALYFCTGANERKADNLAHNRNCLLTTGTNTLEDGLDIVVEGEAGAVESDAERQSVAAAFEAKYGPHLTDPNGTWFGLGDTIRADEVLCFRVAPRRAFGFRKGSSFSQTRWQFT